MINCNAIDVVNDIFPDDKSCSNASEILLRLKLKEKLLDEEVKDIIRGNSRNAINGTEELEIAKVEIKELFSRISSLKSKAQNSEQLVETITKDLKALDYAKKNLTNSISALKRFQILASGAEQIQILTKNRKYSEMNGLALVVIELISFFDQYKKILKVSLVLKEAQSAINSAKSQACEDFFTKFSSFESNEQNLLLLVEACQLLDVIPSAKEKVMEWYIDLQLKEYRQIFSPGNELAGLENTSRRFGFLKKILTAYEQSHYKIFPVQWAMDEQLCIKFCTETKKDFTAILSKSSENVDVKLLIKTLKETTQLEAQLTKNFGSSNPTNPFNRIISSCFEPFLTYYIEAEDRQLSDFINGLLANEKIADQGGSEADDQILHSSTDLFFIYRSSLSNCSSISNKKSLIELAQVFEKHLAAYADMLTNLLERIGETKFHYKDEKDFRTAIIILNTADYCQNTIIQLEEKVKESIDPEFRDLVSFEGEKEHFLSLVANCVKSIPKALENYVETSFASMSKTNWGAITSVGDQSEYTALMINDLRPIIVMIRKTLTSNKYFKSICDKFAESITNKFYLQLFKLKLISESGAEQLILDSHALKTNLLELPGNGLADSQPHSSYTKILTKGFLRSENLLKSLMSPIDPAEGMVENYILLNADTSIGQFQKVLDLKGVKKQDQIVLVDAFVKKLPTTPSGQEITKTANPVFSSTAASSSSRFNDNLRKMAANIGFKRE